MHWSKFKLFTVVFLMIAFFVGFIFFYEKTVDKLFDLREGITLSHKVNSHMLMLRRNEKDYLARLDMGYIDRFDNNIMLILEDIQQLKQVLKDLPSFHYDTESLEQAVNQYALSFKEIVAVQSKLGYHHSDGLYGSMRESASKAEQLIRDHNLIYTLSDLLMLRRYEKDFQLRREEKFVKRFDHYYVIVKANLEKANIDAALHKQLGQYLDAYHQDFLQYVELSRVKGLSVYEGRLGELSTQAHTLERLLSLMTQKLMDRIVALNANVRHSSIFMMVALSIGVLLAALLPFMYLLLTPSPKEQSASA